MGRAPRAPAGDGVVRGLAAARDLRTGVRVERLPAGFQPTAAEVAAELVEGADLLLGLGSEHRRVDPDAGRVGVGLVVVDPVERVGAADLGVELDRPGALADPAGLQTDLAA